MLDLKPSLHHVTIQTWNTKDEVGTGIDTVSDTWFFGGNIGHASIVMTLPINDETKGWVEKYCYKSTFEEYKAGFDKEKQNKLTYEYYIEQAKPIIPMRKKICTNYEILLNVDGKFQQASNIATSFEYFEITFSWWPDKTNLFNLSTDQEDMIDCRKGRNFAYSEEIKKYLKPEERQHSGLIGSGIKTYAPFILVHQRNLTEDEWDYILLKQQIKKLRSQVKLKTLLINKVNKMDKRKVEGSLKSLCQNIELGILESEYIRDDKNLDEFKEDLKNKISEHISLLKIKLKQNEIKLDSLDYMMYQKEFYRTKGLAPDNSVVLPYCTKDKKGLNPEAMLKQMYDLAEGTNTKFNDILFNCSTSTSTVLDAGAKHDSDLNAVLSKKMFRYFDSPQQLLNNVQRAQEIIESNRKASLLERFRKFNYIDRSIVKLLHKLNDPNNTNFQIGLITLGILFFGIIQIPSMILGALLSPSNAMGGVVDLIRNVYKKSSSMLFPFLITALSLPLLVLLTPFTMVEQVIRLLILPFQWIANWKAPSKGTVQSDESITSPLPTAKTNKPNQDLAKNALRAKTMDKTIAEKIQENTIKLPANKDVEELVANFEKVLASNTNKVIELSPEDLDRINRYLSSTNNTQLKQRFFTCCEQSLIRANNLKPKTPTEFDEYTIPKVNTP